MKYIQNPNGWLTAVDENSDLFTALMAVPIENRPTFLEATDPIVATYLTNVAAAVAEAAKPKEVTMRQARLVLRQNALLATVEAAIAGMTGTAGEDARIEWEYSNTLRRSQPLVIQLGAVLGLNSAQLDALFLTASTL